MEKLVHSVQPNTRVLYNRELRDALKGVYEVYGSDLGAFFRDASAQKHTDDRHPTGPQTKHSGIAARRKAR